ncbi:TIGR04290 family methyltransferase [Luteimonas suaedae]|uniref:TIGR04290 family methyltransferase n=1 Tax=Luteimonas suaedae TaxID=2605430 RepID=UPI0011ED7692|nr:TIGR04290 family methyltransferase [Luteimonas suaedae]
MTDALETRTSSVDADLQTQVQALAPWFHNLHLGNGVETAPAHALGDFPAFKWAQIAPHIDRDLSGWTVLDIGCNAGFYSFELARRGARVTAIDVDEHYLRQARWAAGRFDLADRVEFRQMSVYDLARQPQTYDLVWLMGVFYHLRHPLLALDIVRHLTRRQLVLQTMTLPGETTMVTPADLPLDARATMCERDWPSMAFVEHRVAGDPTNWWVPNHACVQAMLRSAGFEVGARIIDETYLCTPAAAGQAPSVEDELRAATGTLAPAQ